MPWRKRSLEHDAQRELHRPEEDAQEPPQDGERDPAKGREELSRDAPPSPRSDDGETVARTRDMNSRLAAGTPIHAQTLFAAGRRPPPPGLRGPFDTPRLRAPAGRTGRRRGRSGRPRAARRPQVLRQRSSTSWRHRRPPWTPSRAPPTSRTACARTPSCWGPTRCSA